MGIDFVVDLDCAPKRHLGADGLVELVKARSRADTVLDMLRAQGDQRPPSEISFQMVLQTPSGEQRETVTVQSLLDRAQGLEPERAHCAGCPANRDSPGFGCYRSISYPIAEEAEAWLLGLLPDDLDTTAGQLLVRAMQDFEWDGAPVAAMRADDGTFFESRDTLVIRLGDEDGGEPFEISTDQIFHMLFHVGPIGSTHAFMVCLFFGVIAHDIPLDALGDPAGRASALATAVVPEPPTEACQPIAGFLHALITAARLDVDVTVDG